MGDAVFGSMTVDLLTKDATVSVSATKLTEQEYTQWKQEFCWEALKGYRFGEGFCQHYKIIDNILFFERDLDRAEQHIRNYYVSQ
jgi:hypothetical protein